MNQRKHQVQFRSPPSGRGGHGNLVVTTNVSQVLTGKTVEPRVVSGHYPLSLSFVRIHIREEETISNLITALVMARLDGSAH